MNKKHPTAAQKRQLIKDLQTGKISIDILKPREVKFYTFHIYSRAPGFAVNQETGERLTVEKAREIAASPGSDVHWIEFKSYA